MARVLILDDDPGARRALARVVVSVDHTVVQAASGEHALQVAREQQPDVIIADVLMPVMDGFDFVRHLRADASTAAIPVVFHTATYLEDDVCRLAGACGVQHLLAKPSPPDEILRAVERALNADPVAAPAVAQETFDREHLQVVNDRLIAKVTELEDLGAVRRDLVEQLRSSEERYRRLFEQNPQPMVVYDRQTRQILIVSNAMVDQYGYSREELRMMTVVDLLPPEDREDLHAYLSSNPVGQRPGPSGNASYPQRHRRKDGSMLDYEVTSDNVTLDGRECRIVLYHDVTARNRAITDLALARDEAVAAHEALARIELELRLAQKLEAVGQLGAGIAHEINTPVQYVGSTVHFLREAFDDLLALTTTYRALVDRNEATGVEPVLTKRVRDAEAAADLDYLCERLPAAFARSIDGLNRVSTIVAAMRQLSHPPERQMSPVDLGELIRNTLTITASEYKYVADLELLCAENMPDVMCNAGEIGQVLLNLIINASHAISDAVGDSGVRGKLTVTTSISGSDALVSVADTGPGIPDEIAERVYDPFFTTKDVGRGTGQGLAIARVMIVEGHGGQLGFTTKPGQGTTFTFAIPISGAAPPGTESGVNAAVPPGPEVAASAASRR